MCDGVSEWWCECVLVWVSDGVSVCWCECVLVWVSDGVSVCGVSECGMLPIVNYKFPYDEEFSEWVSFNVILGNKENGDMHEWVNEWCVMV